ncbi:MAG: glyoxylate/hydroxypyruvate reductase A [Gammaproteobacteria bacterium]|nr:glyoxylate/hydroxypyruvate reductase A [Gammaproteobacteria bacterium]
MSFLINMPSRNTDKLRERLSQDIPLSEIEIYPDVQKPEDVEFALVWHHQPGSLKQFPNLKAISSFGAGVDSILSDPELPDVPITRIVDSWLASDMAKFIVTTIQQHTLRFAQFRQQQSQQLWKPKSKRKGNRVGILGLGQLGQKAAELLNLFGYQVSGWSQSVKKLTDVNCLTGEDAFRELVQGSDYLVCLLPLTPETTGILNEDVFRLMPNDSVLINVARGQHVVERDLLAALNAQQLEHAYLDVFSTEPLPPQHDFWVHPNITITPHISAVTDLETAVSQIVENYQRLKATGNVVSLKHVINIEKGY